MKDEPHIAVLAYHKIGEPPPGSHPTWNYVPEYKFGQQLTWLRNAGYQAIDIDTFLRGLDSPETLPQRTVLLTFDDGYQSLLGGALNWLQQFGWPAIVFVPTGLVGRWNTFDSGIEPAEPICSWDELQSLRAHGFSIQAHGVSHQAFSELYPSDRLHEVRMAKQELEQRLGTSIQSLAYPYGDPGPEVDVALRAAIQSTYRAAFMYKGGAIRWPIPDVHRLPRIPIGPDSDFEALLSK